MIENIKRLMNSLDPDDQELAIQLAEELDTEGRKKLLETLMEENPELLKDREARFLKRWIEFNDKGEDDSISPFTHFLTIKNFNSWISKKV